MLGAKTIFRGLPPREIVVIVTVVILVVLVLSKVNSFFRENILVGEKQTVADIKVGIGKYFLESATKGRSPLYPASLDSALNKFVSKKNPFFTNILAYPGVTSNKWRKLLPSVYQGPSGSLYFYASLSGDFAEKTILSEKIMHLLGISLKKITADLVSQLISQTVVIFADGKRLVGGAVVQVPRLNGKFILKGEDSGAETFSYLQGNLQAEITSELSASGPKIKFGYYTIDPASAEKKLYEIFDGSETPGAIKSFSINPGKLVGFYSSTANGTTHTYYSQKDNNPDKFDHFCIYQNNALRKITLACEESFEDGNRDYQDMMVTVSY
jgi:hypothetical protein